MRNRANTPEDPERLREAVQRFVRSFGLLASDRTPCGAPLAISHAHALMFLLSRGPAPTTQREVGRALGIDKSTATRLCAKMESEGHCAQLRSAADGRARLVSLTVRGRRLARKLEASSRARFSAVLAAVPASRRKALLGSLEVLNAAVASAQAHAAEKEVVR